MSIKRAVKKEDPVKALQEFINEAGEPELKTPVVPDLPPEKLWVKKTFYYHPETVEKLELLKVKISAKNGKKIFIQELIDEALEMLFKKYDV